MVPPRLILRFRDFVPGVQTIEVHRALIKNHGFVWWGWWKKAFEDAQLDLLAELIAQAPFEILLMNRDAKQLFRAHVREVKVQLSTAEREKVPLYYRNSADKISAWFAITSIEEVAYREDLHERTGEPTLYELAYDNVGNVLKPAMIPAEVVSDGAIAPRLLHISDLHLGPHHGFRRPGVVGPIGRKYDVVRCIMDDLERLKIRDIGVLVVSGDLTSGGDWSDETRNDIAATLKSLMESLGIPKERVVLVPGNHDMQRYAPGRVDPDKIVDATVNYEHEQYYRFLRRVLLDQDVLDPLGRLHMFFSNDFDLLIGSLNSCKVTATDLTEYGYVGHELTDLIKEFKGNQHRRAFRLLVLHHHLLPIARIEAPDGKAGISLTLDSATVISEAQRSGIQLILHGHQHIPAVSKVASLYVDDGKWKGLNGEDIYIVASGSTGSDRLPPAKPNTYTLVDFSKEKVLVRIRPISPDGTHARDYIQVSLPISPRSLGETV